VRAVGSSSVSVKTHEPEPLSNGCAAPAARRAAVACATDYDCWHETEADVTTDLILANLLQNVEVSKRIVRTAIARLPASRACPCASALQTAIVTQPEAVPQQVKRDLAPIIGR